MERDPLERWLEELQARHLATLSFQEVRRGLSALSSLYVERRVHLRSSALSGAGKRAAFAAFYGPLHFILVREILRHLGASASPPERILDLGCGTGVAAAAWALETGRAPRVLAIDRSRWALTEARRTFRHFRVTARTRQADLCEARLPGAGGAIVAAFSLNEVAHARRERLKARLLRAAERGARLLIVEPIAKTPLPWWDSWARALVDAGGREDTWRQKTVLPALLARLDQATGLCHGELTGRSLYLAGIP